MRLDSLTALRFFAAFSVFLHHCVPLGITFSDYMFNLNLGWTVSFFFVLSGFVLSLSRDNRLHTRRDRSNFIIERFFRIWPLHLTCALIYFLTIPITGQFERYYLFFTLQHAWVPAYSTAFFMNAVSWSISVELFFYIMFPFIFFTRVRNMVLFAMLWAAGVFSFMAVVSWHPQWFSFSPEVPNLLESGVTEHSFFYFFPPVRLCEFIGGMLTYQVFKRVRLSDASATIAQAAALLLVLAYMVSSQTVIAFFYGIYPRVATDNFDNYGMYPLFCVFIWAFAYQDGLLARKVSHKYLVWLGEISFSFYMIHQIVITNLHQNLQVGAYGFPLLWVVVAFAVSVGASWLLHGGVEKPALNFVKRRLYGARPVPPTALAP